jgi:hypothetical protein
MQQGGPFYTGIPPETEPTKPYHPETVKYQNRSLEDENYL